MDIRLRTSRFCSKSRGLPLRLAASRSYEEGGVSSGPMDPSAAHQLAQSILFLSEINVLFGLYWYFNFLGGKSPSDRAGMKVKNCISILPAVSLFRCREEPPLKRLCAADDTYEM